VISEAPSKTTSEATKSDQMTAMPDGSTPTLFTQIATTNPEITQSNLIIRSRPEP
jgi:hypothetical protein